MTQGFQWDYVEGSIFCGRGWGRDRRGICFIVGNLSSTRARLVCVNGGKFFV